MMNRVDWYLYIIRCRDGSLYTGITTDVVRRFAEHQGRVGAKYLRGRSPLILVFEKKVGSRNLALGVERRIKSLPKAKKERLVGKQDTIERIIERVEARFSP